MTEHDTERRWMRLPKNAAYPHFDEIHQEDDWCPKAGCIPVCEASLANYDVQLFYCGQCNQRRYFKNGVCEMCDIRNEAGHTTPSPDPVIDKQKQIAESGKVSAVPIPARVHKIEREILICEKCYLSGYQGCACTRCGHIVGQSVPGESAGINKFVAVHGAG